MAFCGLVGISLSGYILWRSARNLIAPLVPWGELVLFGLLSAAITGVGRLVLGVSEALASRYATTATTTVHARTRRDEL